MKQEPAALTDARRPPPAPDTGPEFSLGEDSPMPVTGIWERGSLMNAIIESALDSFLAIDHEGKILEFNSAAELMFGLARWEAIGQQMAELIIPPRYREAHRRGMARYLRSQESPILGKRIELTAMRADGTEFPVELVVTPINLHEQPQFVGYMRDISERKKATEQLIQLTQYDVLTGLANRSYFREQLSLAMARTKRSGQLLALLFLDLDHFKEVNDTLGHRIGDLVLQAAARLLKESLREVDTIARLGGDEFTIILENITDLEQVVTAAEKIKKAFSEPLVVEGREISLAASIGITIYPGGANNVDALLQNADLAMYRAKAEGRDAYKFFAPEMSVQTTERFDMEILLRHGLEREEFFLHYQPRVAVASGRVVGVEAVIGWQSRELGLDEKGHFLARAEESGLIVPIGDWALRTACAQNKAWQDQGIPPVVMSLNVAPRQFLQKDWVQKVAAALERSGLDPSFVEFAVTEAVVMQHGGKAAQTLTQLRELGIRLAVAEFGTGSSSLGFLKRYPVQTLKIDRSFMQDLTTDAHAPSVVGATIAMAKNLKLRVVAEGVETREQLASLVTLGCDEYQGKYFSGPVPPPDLPRLLKSS
ncbi:MAG: EAL domain-containing protein [Betaproteobacteria bacterium]|nr:EAL domain-containing protein [Betaproteobacteria bacterium]